MTETLATLTDPEIPTTIPDLVIEWPKTYAEKNYLEKKNINEAIHKKLRNKDFYELDMHKIYNIIVGQTN